MKSNKVKMWFQRVSRAIDLRNTKKEERDTIVKMYTSSFFGNVFNQDGEMIDENFVYEYVQVVLSASYSRDPNFFIRTKNPKLGEFAETMELMLNDTWRTKKGKKKTKQAILDAILQTPGFLEIGYLFISEKKKQEKEIEQEFPELKKLGNEKVEEQKGILDETIKEDDVFLNHRSSRDVMWPNGYHDIRESPYMIVEEDTTLDIVLDNPSYKHKDKIRQLGVVHNKISSVKAYNLTALPKSIDFTQIDFELTPITLYHIFDKVGRKRFTLIKGFDEDAIHENNWDYLNEGHVLYPLIFNEIPKTDNNCHSFGLSDIVPLIPQLKELSFITTAMMKHRKRAGTLIIAKNGAVTPAQADKIQKASDIDFVLLDEISEEFVKGFTPPALPKDFYALRGIILESLMRISGYNQLLGVARGVQTATESENVRAGAVLRQSEKVDVVEDFITEVGKGLAALLWEFKNKKDVEEVIGEVPTDKQWPDITKVPRNEARKIINRLLRFSIEAGSMRPAKDEAVERKQWTDLMGVIKANFPGRFNESILLKQLLKKFNFRDIERAVLGHDEEEIAAAQEENKLLLEGVPQVVSPNENHMLHMQVHSQAYETPGLEIPKEMDEHLLKHKQNFEAQNPNVLPQRGDSKIAPQTNNPDQRRGGVTAFPDIVGSVRSSRGVGGEQGGR